ncbi:MAG: hypothetical protein ABIW82_06535 [Dokdonella sp.]
MRHRVSICCFAILAAVMSCLAARQARADEIWHNEWLVQATPPLFDGANSVDYHCKPWTSFGFGSDGDVIVLWSPTLAGMQSLGYQFVPDLARRRTALGLQSRRR